MKINIIGIAIAAVFIVGAVSPARSSAEEKNDAFDFDDEQFDEDDSQEEVSAEDSAGNEDDSSAVAPGSEDNGGEEATDPEATGELVLYPTAGSEAAGNKADGSSRLAEKVAGVFNGYTGFAVGFSLDLAPTIISASVQTFGMGGQAWVGVKGAMLKISGSHYRLPDEWLGAENFILQETSAISLSLDYAFGDNFDEWVIGAGFGVWENKVEHINDLENIARWTNIVFSAGGGYIWKFYGNLYISPQARLIILLNNPDVLLMEEYYQTQVIQGEGGILIGMNFKL